MRTFAFVFMLIVLQSCFHPSPLKMEFNYDQLEGKLLDDNYYLDSLSINDYAGSHFSMSLRPTEKGLVDFQLNKHYDQYQYRGNIQQIRKEKRHYLDVTVRSLNSGRIKKFSLNLDSNTQSPIILNEEGEPFP